VATRLNNLALLLAATNRRAEAEPLYRRALSIIEAAYGSEHPTVASSLNNLALLLAATNRRAEAEPLYRRALSIDEAAYREALAIRERQLEPNHPDIGEGFCNLATCLFQQGQITEALPCYKQSLDIYEPNVDGCDDAPRQWLNNLAICHNQIAFHDDVPAENWSSAETHYRQAMTRYQQAGQEIQSVNSELNLQVMFHLSGQLVDVERVKELTRILDQANDPRAKKGHQLL